MSDPGPLTMRELWWMARGRQQETWQHTAWITAMIANVNRDPKRRPRPFTPDDFNPTIPRRRRARQRVQLADLKGMFVPNEKG